MCHKATGLRTLTRLLTDLFIEFLNVLRQVIVRLCTTCEQTEADLSRKHLGGPARTRGQVQREHQQP
jgi:hypothetical protein